MKVKIAVLVALIAAFALVAFASIGGGWTWDTHAVSHTDGFADGNG